MHKYYCHKLYSKFGLWGQRTDLSKPPASATRGAVFAAMNRRGSVGVRKRDEGKKMRGKKGLFEWTILKLVF
jgi:hypothetical protein